MTDGYVELHGRSAFSFLEGASMPEAMAQQAANLNMPALGILDRDGLYGAPRLYMSAKKLGLRSHIGAEISVAELSSQVLPELWQPHTIPDRPVRLSLLCESQTGYRNLSQLITGYKLQQKTKGEGIASLRSVRENAEGLVCLTGGDEGPLAAALARGGMDEGRRVVKCLVQTFGQDNVYVELQRHRIREQEARNLAAIALARELHLPLLATNGANMATSLEREVLDVLTSIRHRTSLDEAGMLLQQNANRHMRGAAEMRNLFRDLPSAVAETVELSSRLQFVMKDMGYQFPLYPIPEGETMDTFLHKRTMEGVANRYGCKASAKLRRKADKQVGKELALIAKLGLAGYFLIVWDIVEFCRKNGILVQGRGSAANSAVCYSLGITAVDPVGMELLFERFLSEVRGEWPDIDLDLPSGDDREKAIQYVYARYGQLGAAMCANVITYRGRSAAREVGKSLGFDEDTLTRLTRLVGSWEWKGPTDTMQNQFQTAGFDLAHPRIAKYLELSIRMLDLPRHLGQHSGGMIIAQGQLASVVPIEPASMPGRNVIQWDKEDCSDMGLIKVDLLGLGMMAVLKDCTGLIPQHYGTKVDIAQIPHDDAKVYKTLREADTVGLFQVESRAQMASLPRNNPDKFYDLVVQVAIIRPGPIVGQMMNPYMERRQGREEIRYPHPLLEPVLYRTLGVPLFQEQLLRIAMIIANFTGGEAEELRRALGSRRSADKMRALELKLRNGMDQNGVGAAAQEEIIQAISSFALYGFPESHAASFALIAYASAWLKFHYLAAFTAAILNNQPMGFYSPAVLVKDAQRHGLRVKPVDVLRSNWSCTLEKEENGTFSLRLGVRYVRGLRQGSAAELEAAREMRPFASIEELARRVPSLTRADLTTLAEVGALNSIGEGIHRRDALWQVERAGRRPGALLAALDRDEEVVSPLRPMEPQERMVADYASTGVTVGRHPMAHCRQQLRAMRVVRAGDLSLLRHGVKARIAGCVIARQRPGTAHGFIFLSIEDETGIANAIVDPELYERYRSLVTYSKFLLIEGSLQNVDKVIHIRARHIEELSVTAAPMQSHDFH
ncbi:DnaE-like error-prone DNA polymerase [Edaphobacter aggregans]|uniref:Error-prone DNA polymerase n=1 Tax=Edaphobacter aggregans TaxID=570835 RepID=A0A3R9QDI7_9BACT|nr:error-prone DNA polymerase [Edaphobacter aggregans]RSL18727.1 DnaE-like error-prone DNA polymerase [Edaphobacter aggregans]